MNTITVNCAMCNEPIDEITIEDLTNDILDKWFNEDTKVICTECGILMSDKS